MELILWRHAEAEDGLNDLARELTSKGHKQAEKMAAWLKPRLPDNTHVLVSPAKRAQQTASSLTKDFTTEDTVTTGASVQSVLKAANWPHAEGAVLIVGHQPTLGAVAAHLLAGQNTSWSIKKGSIWWLSSQHQNDGMEASLRLVMTVDML